MYYRIKEKLPRLLPDHHLFGYETALLFEDAIYKLLRKWHGQTGRVLEERKDFRLLRIYNEYNTYNDVWFPLFMLIPTPAPAEQDREQRDRLEEQLDEIWGFDGKTIG